MRSTRAAARARRLRKPILRWAARRVRRACQYPPPPPSQPCEAPPPSNAPPAPAKGAAPARPSRDDPPGDDNEPAASLEEIVPCAMAVVKRQMFGGSHLNWRSGCQYFTSL